MPAVSLDRLNTQIAEQTNSVLERIRTQVIFLLHMQSQMQPLHFRVKGRVARLECSHVLVGGLHVA